MKRQILFPIVAMLIATPLWAATNSSAKLSTTALSFNGSSGNISSQPLTFTVTGTRSVAITSLSFSNSAFSLPPVSLPLTVSSGQSVTGQISAQPRSAAQTGTLTIGTTVGTFTVALSETATTPAQPAHSVSLTWKAPSSGAAVDSYQVDRAVSGSTQYSMIGTTTASSTAFTDASVQAGKTYVYAVRAVDDTGTASNPSNTITLAIP